MAVSQPKRQRFQNLVETFGVAKGAIGWTCMILSGVASAMGIIRVLVEILTVGLKPFLQSLVEGYREFLTPLYDLMFLVPWPFTMQEYYVDAFIVYLIGVGISARLYFHGLVKLHRRLFPGLHMDFFFPGYFPRRSAVLVPFNLWLMKHYTELKEAASNELRFKVGANYYKQFDDEGQPWEGLERVFTEEEIENDFEPRLNDIREGLSAARQALCSIALILIIVCIFFVINAFTLP